MAKPLRIAVSDWAQSERPIRCAWFAWLVYALIVTGIVIARPNERTVTDVYREAAAHFWSGQPLYEHPDPLHGFLYQPGAAVAYTSFSMFPFLVGEVLWRWLGMAVLACATWGLWRRAVVPERPRIPGQPVGLPPEAFALAPLFLLMSAIVILTAAGSSRTGQVNSLIGGLMVLGALAAGDGRYTKSAILLSIGVAFKPHLLPLIMVLGVIYPPMLWRVTIGVLAVAAMPWIKPDWTYVWSQHLAWAHKMTHGAVPEPGKWADIAGLLAPVFHGLKIDLPMSGWTLMRAAAAPLALAASWVCVRRLKHDRMLAAAAVATIVIGYLMLFNPRTEGNTYAIEGPVAAFTLAIALRDERRWIAAALGLCCIGLMFSRTVTLGETNFWARPLATIGVLVCLGVMAPRWFERSRWTAAAK